MRTISYVSFNIPVPQWDPIYLPDTPQNRYLVRRYLRDMFDTTYARALGAPPCRNRTQPN
jgi:hypothetical protein